MTDAIWSVGLIIDPLCSSICFCKGSKVPVVFLINTRKRNSIQLIRILDLVQEEDF